MPRINVLEKHVAELIAAGEVVERPCSVVKELVENSIDAGSKNVTVEIQNGGNTFIRVSDDGCGIEKDDIRKAFLRHATSKICQETDLDSIHTFGFRGEALASIAAVAKVELMTRTCGSEIGYCCFATDCEIGDITEAGCPVGTTIVVRDLFYNTPARQKFLKKDITESNAVGLVLDKAALSHPDVKIRFIKDGETKLSTYGNGDLLSVISCVSGKEFAASLIPVDYFMDNDRKFRVHGFITSPQYTKPSRNYQTFFVNMRYVKTNTAMAALEEAFKGSSMVGKFPGCVLFIDIPADTVDVNVHPAKTEVRFQNEKSIFDLVYYGVKSSLHDKDRSLLSEAADKGVSMQKKSDNTASGSFNPQSVFIKNISSDDFRKQYVSESADVCEKGKTDNTTYQVTDIGKSVQKKSYYYYPNIDINVSDDSGSAEETKAPESAARNKEFPEKTDAVISTEDSGKDDGQLSLDKDANKECFKYIGEAFRTYIIIETENSIIFVDKHAAHERILYEKLKSGIKAFDSQMLIKPVTVSLSDEQCEAVTENAEELMKFGFDCEDFGKGTVIVRSIPLWIDQNEVSDVISEISDSLILMKHDITPEKLDWLYANISCRAAVKGNDNNSEEELKTIITILKENSDIKYCPHGRPISTEITKTKLEHLFGRIQ